VEAAQAADSGRLCRCAAVAEATELEAAERVTVARSVSSASDRDDEKQSGQTCPC
jgi:hypothetical protein